MKIFENITRNQKALVFIDLEGTQMTGEVIEIGASLAILNKDGSVKKTAKPFRRYVKAHSRIGPIVRKMTGIEQATLDKEGLTFAHAVKELFKYVGKYSKNCLFVTFGTGDKRMFQVSFEMNEEANREYMGPLLQKNWDLLGFLSQYIKDENGNVYSLTNFLKVFGCDFQGHAHDAYADARNLQTLYEKAITRPDVFVDHYKNILKNTSHLPAPISKVIKRLQSGEAVTPEDYDAFIKGTFE